MKESKKEGGRGLRRRTRKASVCIAACLLILPIMTLSPTPRRNKGRNNGEEHEEKQKEKQRETGKTKELNEWGKEKDKKVEVEVE